MTNSVLKPTVFVIDDDPEILRSITWLLESVKLEVECFESAIDFLNAYDRTRCGCIVTDVRMPDLGGIQLLEQLNLLKNKIPIIVITGHGDIPMAVRAIKMGAVDFITKPFNDQYLLELIQKSINYSIKLCGNHDDIDVSAQINKLSAREKEIMDLIIEGNLNKQIARALNIAVPTVEFHRARLMKKMKAKNVAQLIKTYLCTINN